MRASPAPIALVTGGTDGIGKAIAHGLARAGVSVLLVGSNPEKGEAAAEAMREASRNDRVQFIRADLSLMREVEALGARIAAEWPQLHYLVLCAGMVRGRYSLTPEGLEANFALNYLGRFALTQRLLPSLAAAGAAGATARILVINGAVENGRIRYDDVNLTGSFGILRAVAQFCGANDAFVVEQARRLAESALGARVTIATLKVGAVKTRIREQFPLWMKLAVPLLIDPFLAVEPEAIAASALSLILDRAFEGRTGALFLHIKRFKPASPAKRAHDAAHGPRVWDLSQRLLAQALAAGVNGSATNATAPAAAGAY
jgi:NAD(P)-dependent dehydrogenase (short-subunit alcohol dehydrogenase family)